MPPQPPQIMSRAIEALLCSPRTGHAVAILLAQMGQEPARHARNALDTPLACRQAKTQHQKGSDMTKRDRTSKPKRGAHTELRPAPAAAPDADAAKPPKPAAGPVPLPKGDDDGLDDLFNDMPV